MVLLKTLQRMFHASRAHPKGSRRGPGRRHRPRRLALEALEDRMLLAYDFALIADDSLASPFGLLRFSPTINNVGTVAYQGVRRLGGEGVFTLDGLGQGQIIATADDLVHIVTSSPTINDAGAVAFRADLAAGGQGILSGKGQELTRIADTDPATSPFSSLPGAPAAISNAGVTTFRATLRPGGQGVFTGSGGSPGTVLVTDGLFFSFRDQTLVNNQGAVALFAVLSGGFDGIYTVSDGTPTLVAHMTTIFSRVSAPAGLNDAGGVVFQATLDGGGEAIVASHQGEFTFLATTGAVFSSLGGPGGTSVALNNAGEVVFFAELVGGGRGIFKGPDPVADKVLAVGDPLFGSTVAAFPGSSVLTPRGLNDAGQVVFLADLADGRRVIVRADPLPCAVSLVPRDTSPGLLGNGVPWTVTASHCGQTPVYQFSVGPAGGPYRVVRDFSTTNSFTWVPMQEDNYEVRVVVKDGFSGTRTESAVVPYVIFPRTTGPNAVITPTSHPLVALYSVPPSLGDTVFVQFSEAGDQPSWRSTATLAAEPGKSTNFVVAGLLPDTTYQMRHVLGDGTTSSPLPFTTGRLPPTLALPDFTVLQEPGPGSDLSQDVVLHTVVTVGASGDLSLEPVATDLAGRVTWYSTVEGGATTTLVPGGTVLVLSGSTDEEFGFTFGAALVRETDLAGNLLRETNWRAVNAQLAAMGHQAIFGFHHDVQRLPNGHTAVLAYNQRTVEVNGTPTFYVGDMVLVLDEDFQVAWAWDAFDHLDVQRGPILTPGDDAADWLHSNSVAWSPADGNLVVSVRHQDWVIKIDYRNGAGDGHVVWRLGLEGDFALGSADPYPWFSHQHDARYIDDTTLVLFDNGNTRRLSDPGANSRGQVLVLNEETWEATLVLSADLGNYSAALGGAQRLPNGNYVFTSGFLGSFAARSGQSIEVLPDGTPTYVLEAPTWVYRSYRLSGLYG